jgi:hypothetical protein
MFKTPRKRFWQWRAQRVSKAIEALEKIQKRANKLPAVEGIHDVFAKQLRRLRLKKLAIMVHIGSI